MCVAFLAPGTTLLPIYTMMYGFIGRHLDGAKESDKVLKCMARSNRKACAFICESLLSCGGQVILPEGYLKAVYKKMRARGALCIADEVQCGFGRVGTHFWGFESQGVVPDMVVLGKSIGNGFRSQSSSP